MTLAEIMAAVRRQTLDTSSSLSDADLTNIVADGYRLVAVADRWPWLATSAQITVVSGMQEYDISADLSVTDFMWLDSIVDNDEEDGLLDQLSVAQYLLRWGGDPDSGPRAYSYYFKNDDTVGLVPVPNTSETDAYTLNYFKAPTVLSASGDSPEWTATLHHILVSYAASNVWEREEYFTERDLAFRKFAMGIAELKRFYKMRTKDRPIVFGDGGGGNRYGDRASLVHNLPFG